MAVSPLVLYNGGAAAKASIAKAKPLTMRPGSNETAQRNPSPSQNTGPELAEQLNENEKQKYVKGRCWWQMK